MDNTREEQVLNIELILHKAGVGEGMTVADFGCGTGHFVFPIARIVGGKGLVYAVDILKTALRSVKRRIELENFYNIKPIWSDFEIYKGTKIESSSLDVALLVNTLHQSKQKGAILREVNRTVKKGSVLLVIE